MHSPEVARSLRRSWQEIATYYEAGSGLGNWAKLSDFARSVKSKPYAHGLISVGTLGCILVFRDAECAAENGYFLIAGSPTERTGDIRLGFFTTTGHDPAKLKGFGDVGPAIEEFERDLAEHGFIPGNRT